MAPGLQRPDPVFISVYLWLKYPTHHTTILDSTTKMTLNMSQQSSSPIEHAVKLPSGRWFWAWRCGVCMDSGIAKGLLGWDQCKDCQAHLDPVSYRIFGALSHQLLKSRQIDEQLLNMARALVMASADAPLQGEALAQLLDCSDRQVKKLAARLCEEWRLPAIATRNPPYGYFIATSAEQLLEWGRYTRSQAIRMLARYYHLFKANYPELAGQKQLDFIETVSTELQEAIR